MPTGSNMEAVRAAYQAFTANDPERFVALLEPEFVSRQSEAVRWRGTYRGPDGVTEMFGRVATRATATYEPGEVIDGGDRIVVVGRARITLPRRPVSPSTCASCTFGRCAKAG
jgi:uncharacterized protein